MSARRAVLDYDFELLGWRTPGPPPVYFSTGAPLRGIKDSPPNLHHSRLLTLADTVEFFNVAQELRLIS